MCFSGIAAIRRPLRGQHQMTANDITAESRGNIRRWIATLFGPGERPVKPPSVAAGFCFFECPRVYIRTRASCVRCPQKEFTAEERSAVTVFS
jgi:hypothetical protein